MEPPATPPHAADPAGAARSAGARLDEAVIPWLERAPRYREWQFLLEDAFLSRAAAPTVLFIDDDELHRLCPHLEDPASALTDAVREMVNPALGRNMFNQVAAVYRRWSSSPKVQPPPVLPLLALTVLAATRMRRDSTAQASNYYRRLAETLLPGAGSAEVESIRNLLRDSPAFAGVGEMWRALDCWIEQQDGAAGISMIRDHPRLSRIGYPLSQAVMRGSDRTALTKFFAALETTRLGVPEDDALFRYLELWAARPRGFSDAYLHALADDNLKPLVSALVHRLAQSWDGEVRTPEGRRSLELHLALDLDEWQARWLVAADNGPEELALTVPGGTRLTLAREHGVPFYTGGVPFAVEGRTLQGGLRLGGETSTAEFPGRRVVLFRRHAYTGTWVSCEGLIPYEEHTIAVAADMATSVLAALQRAASNQVRLVRQRPPHVLLEGFALFEGIRFEDPQRLRTALQEFPALRQLRLIPEGTARPRLVRGLPLARNVSRSSYLTGGEPDLILPSGPTPRTVTVTLDGASQQLLASGFPIELRRFGPLGAGKHEVTADGERLEFNILDAEPGPGVSPGSGAPTVEEPAGQASAVRGALVDPPDMAVPFLARRGRRETVILLEGGRTQTIHDPAGPAFLEEIPGGAQPPYFEVHPPPGACWMAQRRQNQWDVVSLNPSHLGVYTLSQDVPQLWRQVCSHEAGDTLWRWHLNSAGGPHDR